jgi:CRP-like cAMP-binding protein
VERLLGSRHNMIGTTSQRAATDAATLSREVIIAKGETVLARGQTRRRHPEARFRRRALHPAGCSEHRRRGPDDTLGRLELLSGQRRGDDALALTELGGFRFSGDDFFALLETHPKVGVELLTTVARQLRAKTQEMSGVETLL